MNRDVPRSSEMNHKVTHDHVPRIEEEERQVRKNYYSSSIRIMKTHVCLSVRLCVCSLSIAYISIVKSPIVLKFVAYGFVGCRIYKNELGRKVARMHAQRKQVQSETTAQIRL